MNQNVSPFEIPEIVQRKVHLHELHDMLRLRINTGYMPSDFTDTRLPQAFNRPSHNSKPRYDEQSPNFKTFLEQGVHNDFPEIFSWKSNQSRGESQAEQYWAVIPLTTLSFAVGLTYLDTLVTFTSCQPGMREWIEWSNPEKLIAVDRFELMDKLEYMG